MKGKGEHEGRNVPNALNKGRTSVTRKQLQPSWTVKQALPQNHLKHSYFHQVLHSLLDIRPWESNVYGHPREFKI